LQIEQYANVYAQLGRHLADGFDARVVLLPISMTGVEAKYVDTAVKQSV
jgi:hypothetical protein